MSGTSDEASDAGPSGARGPSLTQRLQPLLTVAGLIGIGLAARELGDDLDGRLLPSGVAIALAFVASVLSLLAAGRAWLAVLENRGEPRRVLGAFYTSQLTKYLPAGGVIQAFGQVTLSAGDGVPLRTSAVALPVFAVASVVSGLTLSAGLVLHDDLPAWARVLAALAPLSLVLTRQPLLRRCYNLARRVVQRLPADDGLLPSQAAIDRGVLWAAANLMTFAAAFTVLVIDLDRNTGVAPVFFASIAAWVLGFLVVPLPSGLGVREAVLIAALPDVEAAVLLSCSLGHRVAVLAAEVAVVAANRVLRARRTAAARAAPR
jgi:uncharacterized membrane protein YbhN (UPF0104 family)